MTDEALRHFPLEGAPVLCRPHGRGHLHKTYLVETDRGRRYILQRLNRTAFRNIPALMDNIDAVTNYLRARTSDPRGALRLIHTGSGGLYYEDGDGQCWRVFDYIDHTVCLQLPERPEDLYESALAFGRFQQAMADFPAAALYKTIPRFHDTPNRYEKLRRAVEEDVMGRAAGVRPELDFLLAREEEMGTLCRMRSSGELPLRVTHNDTKLNNVLLDEVTRKSLCVIDLDTVMPGLAAYDYDDAIRSGAATAPEDGRDLTKLTIDLESYRVFTRGFLEACPGLTPKEVESLPLGAKTMTAECGARFLTDYLEGDVYFSTEYAEHNLVRCRTQLRLVAEMERNWARMTNILMEESVR